MSLKNFKTVNGIDIDSYTFPVSIVQKTVKTNSATTVDTLDSALFLAIDAMIHITQGSKRRTSSIVMQTNGLSVDLTEYGIIETGGAISGVAITASMSGTDVLLKCTVTDGATNPARVRIVKNTNYPLNPMAPGAPSITTLTPGNARVTVGFDDPNYNGGSTITSYTITSSPEAIVATGSSSPIVVTGLTNDTSYTFTMTATNAIGESDPSSESSSATPVPPPKFAYFLGGNNDISNQTTVDKVNMYTDSVSTLSTGLSAGQQAITGFANSGVAGYAGGGYNGSWTRNLEKFTFPGDSRSILTNILSNARTNMRASFANSGTAGYVVGGSYSTDVNKISFSNDSSSTLANSWEMGLNFSAGVSNNGVAGYTLSGVNSSGYIKWVFKMPYSNETEYNPAAMIAERGQHAAFANSGVAAYVLGGYSSSGRLASIEKLNFSNDSSSSVSSTLSTAREIPAASANSGIAGYVAGGYTSSGPSNGIEKLLFSNDTISTLSGTLSVGRYNLASFANSDIL